MDFTEDYIKMNENNDELQKDYELHYFDYIYDNYMKFAGCLTTDNQQDYGYRPYLRKIDAHDGHTLTWDKFKEESDRYIWLPTQSQLQNMLLDEYIYYWMGQSFNDYFTKNLQYANKLCSSFEKMWLAFVMHKKYDKQWDFDKKEWIRI